MSIPWNREAAAHLFRRAGFGATPAELDRAAAMGLDATVEELVHYEGVDNTTLETDLARLTAVQPPASSPVYNIGSTNGIQRWFLHRMVFTKRPLEEKMTYFWNLLFTSGIAKVNEAALILNQNKTERSLAVGRFDDLVLAITKDPAMIIWLDNNRNVKGRPNENYARELMELFTIGVDNYTQSDVADLARSLTGWTIAKPPGAPVSQYTFFFNASQHDSGSKTILGKTGHWNADETIQIILDHADSRGSLSGRFLARKLWTFFGYNDPPGVVVDELAAVYVSSNRSIRAMLDRIFRMPEFYEPHTRKALVRSPVEYLAAALRQLEARTDFSTPANFLIPMGQYLFNPVDALGWEGDLEWINTGTVFARSSMTNSFVTNRGSSGTRVDIGVLVAGKPLATAADVVNVLADRLGLSDAPPDCRAIWEKYVDSKADGSRGYWQPTPTAIDQKVRGLLHLMLTSPDYHLC